MSDNNENEAVFGKFQELAVDVLQVPKDKVTMDATFADLEADSLDLVELVMALEEEFEIEVPETELEGVKTVGQAYELVESKIAQKGA
jgi:acyl carrier protein